MQSSLQYCSPVQAIIPSLQELSTWCRPYSTGTQYMQSSRQYKSFTGSFMELSNITGRLEISTCYHPCSTGAQYMLSSLQYWRSVCSHPCSTGAQYMLSSLQYWSPVHALIPAVLEISTCSHLCKGHMPCCAHRAHSLAILVKNHWLNVVPCSEQ
jgi:hypothetical protein